MAILSWSPSTDPDAPYNRSGVSLKNKYVDSATTVNPNARVNEAKINPLSAFAPTSDNPSQGSSNINYYYQFFIVDQPEYFLYVSFIILI